MQAWYKRYWHLVTHPYNFFEEKISMGNLFPATIFFIIALTSVAFGWVFIAESHANLSALGIYLTIGMITYPTAVTVIYLVCRFLVRETRLRSFFSVWGFSYLPTLVFFSFTILAHLLQSFSSFKNLENLPVLHLLLLAFLILIFLWKMLLLTITLRLAGNLNLTQIILAVIILLLAVGCYWWFIVHYKLGKVPFI